MNARTDALLTTVAQSAIDDLHRRLDRTIWPNTVEESSTIGGISVATVRRLAERWRSRFDWRDVEQLLDRLGQVTTRTADGRQLHAIHTRGAVPGEPDGGASGVPVLLIHGWPDSPLRFAKLVPMLAAAGHDVVAPAIPGFGFSEQPAGEMSRELVAEDFHRLMAKLGHGRYAVHGGDWGGVIATALARAHPEAVVALHLTDVPFDKAFEVDGDSLGPAESAFVEQTASWAASQLYLQANSANPDTLSIALADSPVGLLAWIAEKFLAWNDEPIDDDDILAQRSAAVVHQHRALLGPPLLRAGALLGGRGRRGREHVGRLC